MEAQTIQFDEITKAPTNGEGTFIPSAEWQTVPDGFVCPNGGEFRMNLQTGKNEARWVEPTSTGIEAPTLAEMEADVEKTYATFRQSGWEWAKAIARIHESKRYPHFGEPDGWARYMKERWNIERAQAFRYVAWVRDEIKLLVELQPDTENESIPGDTQELEPPETPAHKTERASRKARTSRKRGHLNEDDLDELLDHGNAVEIDGQFYALGTEEAKAELARRAAQKQALKKAVEKFPPKKQEEQQVTPPVEPSSTQKYYIMEDGEGGYCTTDEPPEVIDASLLGTAYDSEENAQKVIDEILMPIVIHEQDNIAIDPALLHSILEGDQADDIQLENDTAEASLTAWFAQWESEKFYIASILLPMVVDLALRQENHGEEDPNYSIKDVEESVEYAITNFQKESETTREKKTAQLRAKK